MNSHITSIPPLGRHAPGVWSSPRHSGRNYFGGTLDGRSDQGSKDRRPRVHCQTGSCETVTCSSAAWDRWSEVGRTNSISRNQARPAESNFSAQCAELIELNNGDGGSAIITNFVRGKAPARQRQGLLCSPSVRQDADHNFVNCFQSTTSLRIQTYAWSNSVCAKTRSETAKSHI